MAFVSTLETLPDELLLEVCKYLLPIDILQSFFDLNQRMTRMIKHYRDNVSLYKGSFAQCAYVYTNVLPAIGSNIRTLVFDRLYSVLQMEMFDQCFRNQKLSNVFPRLEKVTLIAFRHGALLKFLHTLEGFEYLVQLNIRSLFSIPSEQQSTVVESLFKVNNQKIQSIIMGHNSDCLHLDNLSSAPYPNIVNLQIRIERFKDFQLLFTLVPNLRQLKVTFAANDHNTILSNHGLPPLIYLSNFQLTSVSHGWYVEELGSIFRLIPNVKHISLDIFAATHHLIDGQQILQLRQLLIHLQQFNYRVYYRTVKGNYNHATTLASWPSSSIECLVDEILYPYSVFVFIQTLSSYSESFTSLGLPGTIITKVMRTQKNDSQVEELDMYGITTLVDCFPVLSRWRRIQKLMIWFSKKREFASPVVEQQQQNLIALKLTHLNYLKFHDSIPSDLEKISLLLVAAPNLIRLDLTWDGLLPLLDHEETRRLFQQRIRLLSINKASSSSSNTIISEDHISRIASIFSRLRNLYVNLTYAVPSMDIIVLRILMEFKGHLVSLGADGQPSNEMKTDARKWLDEHNKKNNMNIVHPTNFDAYFNIQANRLLIWM